jgi:4-hydroxy-2-oxoheptanedioate aldolase
LRDNKLIDWRKAKAMKANNVKRKWLNKEPVIGVISPSSDPSIAEFIGLQGFDFYMIDGEHGALGPAEAINIVRACESVGITPLARVRNLDAKLILQFLDAGVMGIMMPGIMNAADVRLLVDAVRYPPIGSRGLGPIRAADYMMGSMSQAEYVSFANEQLLVLPQVEDIEAIEHLEEMAEVPGIDGFVVGPRDLAMSMGFNDGPGHDEVQATIETIYETVLAQNLVYGTVAGTGEAATDLAKRGVLLCLTSVQGLIKQASTAYTKSFKP